MCGRYAVTAGLCEQLEIDFDFPLGTVEDARIIFDAVELGWHNADDVILPDGWSFVGSGGTRRVYRSPSGVVYKVEYSYGDGELSWNEMEYENFRRIKQEGNLPGDWRVPRSYLHTFRANIAKWEYPSRKKVESEVSVGILACEYIKGRPVGGWCLPDPQQKEKEEATVVFSKIGLNDLGGQNVILTDEGNYYIIDAAERMED
mgnify:CR=1 FL=1